MENDNEINDREQQMLSSCSCLFAYFLNSEYSLCYFLNQKLVLFMGIYQCSDITHTTTFEFSTQTFNNHSTFHSYQIVYKFDISKSIFER